MESNWINFEYIESKENKNYKILKKINLKKYRDENNIFIAEGEKFFEEAHNITRIVVAKSKLEYYSSKYDLSKFSKVVVLNDNLFNEISTQENSQGILFIHSKNTYKLSNIEGDVIILDSVQDPGNVGTIIRTLVGLNYRNLVLIKGSCDVYMPKVVRASMGSIFKLNIVYCEYDEIIEFLKEKDYRVFATALRKESINYIDCKLIKNKNAYIFGNEGGGVSDKLLEICDYKAIIPISNEINSLNVSVALAVFLFKMRELKE